jgi:hypothetical protein
VRTAGAVAGEAPAGGDQGTLAPPGSVLGAAPFVVLGDGAGRLATSICGDARLGV